MRDTDKIRNNPGTRRYYKSKLHKAMLREYALEKSIEEEFSFEKWSELNVLKHNIEMYREYSEEYKSSYNKRVKYENYD